MERLLLNTWLAAFLLLPLGCGARSSTTHLAADGGPAPLGADLAVLRDSSQPSADREPLALFFRTPGPQGSPPTLHALPLVDRSGRKVGDLADALFQVLRGASYQLLELTCEQTIVSDGSTFRGYPIRPLAGQARPLAPTQVVAHVRLTEGGAHRLVGLDGSGALVFLREIDPTWERFQLSPGGRYLLGRSKSGGGILLDTADPTRAVPLSELKEFDGAFSEDDALFVRLGGDASRVGLNVRELAADHEQLHLLPGGGDPRWAVLAYVSAAGSVLQTSAEGSSSTTVLWFLHRDGRWARLHPPDGLPRSEQLHGVTEQGELIFSRSLLSNQPTFYRFDPAAPSGADAAALPVAVPAEDLATATFSAGRMLYLHQQDGQVALMAWPLDAAQPTRLASIGPAVQAPWRWTLRGSDASSIIVVQLMLSSATLLEPPTTAATVVLDASGERRMTLPWGETRVDRTGRLALYQALAAATPSDPTPSRAVIDLAQRSQRPPEVNELSYGLIYRSR